MIIRKLKSFTLHIILSSIFASAVHAAYDKGKSIWLNDAFNTILADEDIKAISYWNENWEDKKPVRMAIDSSRKSLDIYRKAVGKSYFISSLNLLNGKVIPPNYGAYHSAYPGFAEKNGEIEVISRNKIENFIQLATKDLAWVYFSNSWDKGILFPKDEVDLISSLGKTPFIRMLPWSEVAPHLVKADPLISMQKIIDGKYDADLSKWALAAKLFKKPLIIEFGTEVNGNWMPWNGQWNGKNKNNYGDPAVPDGPERFRDAYRHIINIFNYNKVNNITWFFHVNYSSGPDEEWNNIKYYYPGNDYIDWLGVSIYGPLFRGQEWSYSFNDIWNYIKPQLRKLSSKKPIAILEFGAGEH